MNVTSENDALRSKNAVMSKALERIVSAANLDCGCKPCTGACASQEALRIVVEGMRDEAEAALAQGKAPTFQQRVYPWMMVCFGDEISADTVERNHRFIEEAVELVQACGCTREDVLQLVDYVFSRPAGEPYQEVGGVQVTLAALCLAQKLDMEAAAETELARIWTKVEQIRAKQATKPRNSPLPAFPAISPEVEA